ncbi:MAG: hypothetical protein E7426_02455 [Ruminococcaceae bacterium]|jgi:chromosome segregation ATPase|nr:hypothetical protein [Oscillospiraceae bacterium]
MTDQELRKLKRSELLTIMLHQGKTVAALQEQLAEAEKKQAETAAELETLTATYERLRKKLDEKDATIRQLRRTAQGPGGAAAGLESDLTSISASADKLSRVAETARRAVELHIAALSRLADQMPQSDKG